MPLVAADLGQHRPTVAPLARRANAAVVDMVVVGLPCFGLLWSMRHLETPRRQVALACATVLAGLLLIEMLSGWTPGKATARLTVRREDGRRPPLWAKAIRFITRELPVGIFIPCLFVRNELLSLALWGISLTVVCCYVCAAYMLLMRSDRTPFDSAAGTVVVEARRKTT